MYSTVADIRSCGEIARRGRTSGALSWLYPWKDARPDRGIFATTPEWYERQLWQHGVDIRLNTEATAGLILAEEPGAILIGTGAALGPAR